MKVNKLWLLACLPLVMAACGGGDEAETEGGDTMAADTGAVLPPPPPADTGMGAGATTSEQTMSTPLTLNAVGGSSAGGTAAISEQGTGTTVVLTVNNAGGAGTHQAHIHTGTCDAPGAPVAPLQAVTTDATGNGTSTSNVDVPMMTVMNGQHIVAVHETNGNPGNPILCAAIPAHSM